VQLGYILNAGSPRSFPVNGVFRRKTPTGALVTFEWFAFDQSVPTVTVNGHVHATAWPFDDTTSSERVIAVPIPADETVDGTNTITFTASSTTVVHNINLILVDASPVP
jgi:hypothetical protein